MLQLGSIKGYKPNTSFDTINDVFDYINPELVKFQLVVRHLQDVVEDFDSSFLDPLTRLAGLETSEETIYNLWLFNQEAIAKAIQSFAVLRPQFTAAYRESMKLLKPIFMDNFHYWAYLPKTLRPIFFSDRVCEVTQTYKVTFDVSSDDQLGIVVDGSYYDPELWKFLNWKSSSNTDRKFYSVQLMETLRDSSRSNQVGLSCAAVY